MLPKKHKQRQTKLKLYKQGLTTLQPGNTDISGISCCPIYYLLDSVFQGAESFFIIFFVKKSVKITLNILLSFCLSLDLLPSVLVLTSYLLNVDVEDTVVRNHTQIHHSQVDSSGRGIGPSAETSTWHHTTLTRDRHLCPRRDSNSQSQQTSSRRPMPPAGGHYDWHLNILAPEFYI